MRSGVIALILAALGLAGCASAGPGEQVLGGGAIGTALGAIVGAIGGNAGLGAAAGAMAGLVGGAIAAQHKHDVDAAYQKGLATPRPPTGAVALPVGTLVPALPPGCTLVVVNQVQHFNCQGVFYRPTPQGAKIYYEVVLSPA